MQILTQKENIFGRHFLEASAGTGKTFVIEHLFVRLLLEGENPLRVDQILVMTFTKAAARELKERIYLAVQKALSFLKESDEENCSLPYLAPFLKKELAISRLEEALTLFDEAAVFTIHGFCFAVLKRFAFFAEPAISFQEKEQTFLFLKEKAFEYFYYFIDSLAYSPMQIAKLIKGAKSLDLLIDRFLASEDKNNENLKGFTQVLTDLNFELGHSDFVAEAVFQETKLKEEIESLIPLYKRTGFDLLSLRKEVDLFFKVLKNRQFLAEDFDLLGETDFALIRFFAPENQKKKTEIKTFQSLFFKFYKFLDQKVKPCYLEAFDSRLIFLRLSFDLNQWLKLELAKEELFTFDDLLGQMKLSLHKPLFKEKVKQLYRAAIIDEFQDTDPLQWDILSDLFLDHEDLKAFYLVGDPKQSIYSFRRADLYTYFQAKESFGQKAFSTLDTNYRSSEKLMQSLNYLFSDSFAPAWIKLPKLGQILPYLEVKAGKREKVPSEFEASGKLAVHFLLTDMEVTDEDNLFCSYLVSEISQLQHYVALDEIAVLVKDRFQAEWIRTFLERYNIPCVYKSQRSLAESKAALPFQELLEALDGFQDFPSLRKVLLGRYFQYSPEELGEEVLHRYMELFSNWKEVLGKQGLPIFLNRFLNFEIFDKTTILSQMVSSFDAGFYKETMQLFQFLIEEAKNFSSRQILELLDKLSTLDPQDDGRLFLKPEAEKQAVQIMTMHMSKGLEFAVVFAFGPMVRTPEADVEKEAEKLRQLYVTLTRASKRVYIPLALDKPGIIKDGTASPLELFLNLVKENEYIASKEVLEEKLQKAQMQGFLSYEWLSSEKAKVSINLKKEPVELTSPSLPPIPFRGGRMFSFSALSAENEKAETEVFEEEMQLEKENAVTKNFLFSKEALPPGAEFGLLAHALFEELLSGLHPDFTEPSILQKVIKQKTKGSSWQGKTELLQEMVLRAVTVPLFPFNFSLCSISLDKMRPESEFLYQIDKLNLMKGFIDLIFEHDGKFYLLDWKTNYLGDNFEAYAPEQLALEMEKKNYFLQAAIYTEALKQFFKEETFNKKFGGVFYLFLRGLNLEKPGSGIFYFYPDLKKMNLRQLENFNFDRE